VLPLDVCSIVYASHGSGVQAPSENVLSSRQLTVPLLPLVWLPVAL
jgi:hypothetical protein